jgi:glycosyltransferase involved in cell wall biosynthesis
VVLAVGAPEEAIGAVRSLLKQSPPVEIVVVNTGGGDMRRRLAQSGITVNVVEREERLFVGAARNLGIEATRAKYVAFLASDCRARKGWARERLKAHRDGHLAVGSAVENSHPRNPFAWAHYFTLWPRRLPSVKEGGLAFGASYHRWLFKKYGMFRGDLRTAEDAEFHDRLGQRHRPVWRWQVRTIHRNPTGFLELLSDQFKRGSRAARAGFELRREPFPRDIVAWGWRRARFAMRIAIAHAPERYRRYVYLALPFIPLASVAYCAGVVHWHRTNGLPLGKPYSTPQASDEVH